MRLLIDSWLENLVEGPFKLFLQQLKNIHGHKLFISVNKQKIVDYFIIYNTYFSLIENEKLTQFIKL